MAHYTETLGEYLKDHELPEIFSLIYNFDKFFTAKYIDREIGFETELLFETKLEGRALKVIPLYANRIAELEAAKAALSDPNYKVTNTRSGSQTNGGSVTNSGNDVVANTGNDVVADTGTDTFNKDEQNSTLTQLPINATTAEPNQTSHVDETEDTTTYGKTTTTTHGLSTTTTHGLSTTTNDTTTYNNVKDEQTFEGYTTQDNLARIQYIEGRIIDFVDLCLVEFENLFMQTFKAGYK